MIILIYTDKAEAQRLSHAPGVTQMLSVQLGLQTSEVQMETHMGLALVGG